MVIFFDTETTGLPKNYNAPADQVDNWPRIIQLAYACYTLDGQLISQAKHLIKPDGWQIPTKETFMDEGKTEAEAITAADFWVRNGYTMELLNEQGRPIKEVLDEYIVARNASLYAVAHNISFDGKIIRAEMFRADVNTVFTAFKYCTMKQTTQFCNIPKPGGGKGAKFPKLTELHKILFGDNFAGAHDAGNDVAACARCFFELIRLGVFKYNKNI